jgi:hypothetical protein
MRPGRCIAAALAAAALLAPVSRYGDLAAQQVNDVASLRTAPERTNFRETTRYDEVLAWLEAVAAHSPLIHVDTFGYTLEGRPLPLAVVGRLADRSPAGVRASGRTVVYLQGSIHAGEVEGKEALLMLLRELSLGQRQQLLDSLVLLIAPIYNADGNERVLLTNRPAQHGPVGGMGQRPNAQGFDLNRDHTKLASPEARSLAQMLTRYDPHMGIDLHTTNGTRHAYHLTYSPPLHPNTHPAIVQLLRGALLPEVTASIRSRHGWDLHYYGNVYGQGEERGWYTFDHRPRFNNNYIGLRNRLAILSEAYAYATFEERILATSRFIDEILAWTAAGSTRVRQVVDDASRAPVIGERLALRAEFQRSAQPVQILMGEVAQEIHPFTGAVMLRRLDVRRPEMMHEFGTFSATEIERAPAAYIITEPVPAVLANLGAHGITTRSLQAARELNVEAFRVDSTSLATREFQGQRERIVHGAWHASAATVPAGSVIVPLDQPLARLIFTLLEPRSDDGLVTWNYFDAHLEGGRTLPLLRVHEQLK